MNSFYGGPAGNSFKISKIFRSRIEMDADLNSKADSSIDIGSFVVISYGKGTEAIENRKKDQALYNEDYNGTLWEKIYLEEVAEGDPNLYIFIELDIKGLGYKLITALVGPTPEIVLMPKDDSTPPLDADGLRILDAGEVPTLELDISNAENPRFIFGLPLSLVLELLDTVILDAGQEPDVILNNSDINNPKITFKLPLSLVLRLLDTVIVDNNVLPSIIYDEQDINSPSLLFKLPRGKDVKLREKTAENGLAAAGLKRLKANEVPTLTLEDSDVNTLVLTFGIPVAESIKLLTKEKEPALDADGLLILDAGENPSIIWLDDENGDHELAIKLPRGQVISVGKVDIVSSTDRPQVTMDNNDINNPLLDFKLPRAPIIRLGTKLGEKNGTYILDEDLHNGDLYVNTNKNYVYQVIQENESNVTVQFVQDLQISVPIVNTINNNSYKLNDINEYVINSARIVTGYDESGRWKWDVEIPAIPNFKLNGSFIGSKETGSAVGKPTSENNYTLELKIPAGARFFTGSAEGEDISVSVAKLGDYYLHNNSGNIYELLSTGWVLVSNIKGATGDALNTVANFTFYPSEEAIPQDEKDKMPTGVEITDYIFEDSDLANSNFTEAEFLELIGKIEKRIVAVRGSRDINTDELVTITIVRTKDSISYWFYQNELKQWQVPILITAGITTIVLNEYTDETYGDLNTIMYSVGYINGLISNAPASADKDKKTYSALKIDLLLEEVSINWNTL